MRHPRFVLLALSIESMLALGACSMSPTTSMAPMAPMTSTSTALSAQLSGSSEVPMVVTGGAGQVVASLTAITHVLTWTITYSGLSGPVTAAHFHGPASVGQNAAPVVPINAPLGSPISGSATLTPTQAADLAAGKWYVNLHTAANPGGEVRGQVSLAS